MRLRRLLFEFGPGNGTLTLPPIDQGIEHGPRDFFPNPASKDPEYQFWLAAEAGYSALACQIGMPEEVLPGLRRPGAADPEGQRQDRRAAVGRRARPRTHRSRTPFAWAPTPSATRSTSARRARTRSAPTPPGAPGLRPLRNAAGDLGVSPRGGARRQGGQHTFYAIDYAARMAMEMGADVVKLNMPKIDPEKDKLTLALHNEMEVSREEAIRQCVQSAGRALVVLSGGSKISDEKLLEQKRPGSSCGAGKVSRDHRADQGRCSRRAQKNPLHGA